MTRGCCRNVPDKGNKEGTRADCLPATIPKLLLTYPDLLAGVISQTSENQKHALSPRFVKRHDLKCHVQLQREEMLCLNKKGNMIE